MGYCEDEELLKKCRNVESISASLSFAAKELKSRAEELSVDQAQRSAALKLEEAGRSSHRAP